MKKIFYFLMLNLLIMISISLSIHFLGLNQIIEQSKINYINLILFCAIWGFSGSFISLFLSKTIAKKTMSLNMVNETTNSNLYFIVKRISDKAMIKMPEVGIYESGEINAFATGYNSNNALIGVSSGLLNKMNVEELEGVIAHEISHIKNGDMMLMTLLQGLVNTFSMFLARVIALMYGGEDKEKNGKPNYVLVFILEILFSFLGMFLLAYYSRQREYTADKDGAFLVSNQKMIKALEKLQQHYGFLDDSQSYSTFKISSRKNKILSLLSTHPDLQDRINALKKMDSILS